MAAFFAAILLGFGAAGWTAVSRAIVPQLWLLTKPFGCDLCMSWWCSLAMYFVGRLGASPGEWQSLSQAPVMIGATVLVSLTLLRVSARLAALE